MLYPLQTIPPTIMSPRFTEASMIDLKCKPRLPISTNPKAHQLNPSKPITTNLNAYQPIRDFLESCNLVAWQKHLAISSNHLE